MKTYFISAGELSGDLHASRLAKELISKDPAARLSGIAGPMMRAEGVVTIVPMEQLQVMGFVDVILAFPRLYRIFQKVKNHILTTKPETVVCVDYPGFHLRLAEKLRKGGFQGKIIQYISPTVWAHGKGRIAVLEKYFDQLLCILPFETECFKDSSLKVTYVGHPLAERIAEYNYDDNWMQKCGLNPNKPILALFPGSRPSEIKKHLPTMLKVGKTWDGQVVVSGEGGIPREFTYELMRDCTAAIAKSGTVTLELALHHKPAIVIYETSSFNRWIAKHILKLEHLPYFCLVNILGGREIYPEYIRHPFTPEMLQNKLATIDYNATRDECKKLTAKLGLFQSSKIAAESIL